MVGADPKKREWYQGWKSAQSHKAARAEKGIGTGRESGIKTGSARAQGRGWKAKTGWGQREGANQEGKIPGEEDQGDGEDGIAPVAGISPPVATPGTSVQDFSSKLACLSLFYPHVVPQHKKDSLSRCKPLSPPHVNYFVF